MDANALLRKHLQQADLPQELAQLTESLYLPLLDWIIKKAKRRPMILGINGAQGTGKSTTAEILCLLADQVKGLKAAALSIDDLYKTKAEREELAATHHRLFSTRGVPGTHDLAFGMQLIRALERGGEVRLPRFDKLNDDRALGRDWPLVGPDLDLLIVEGWCIGARPLPKDSLETPVNELEAQEDADGKWRYWINDELEGIYAQFFERLDGLVMLKPKSFEQVKTWRKKQEQRMAQAQGKEGMSEAELERFLAHYERLTEWMFEDLPQVADVLVPIDDNHMPQDPQFKEAP